MKRKKIFYAGPAALPMEVLEQLQEELVEYQGAGLSIMEASHRGGIFEAMYEECLALVRELLDVPEGYHIFFLGGGATLQFAMVPLNFLANGKVADYIRSGSWSNKAVSDAQKVGQVSIYYDGKEHNYTSLPAAETVQASPNSSYLFLCSNETIGGIAWNQFPTLPQVPLVADMSSDILSRPFDVSKFGLIFAGVQKNLGPAGATLVIMRDDMLQRQNGALPAYLDYRNHIKEHGLYNTPPVFTIWAVKLVLEWMKRNGGATGMAQRAEHKAALIYDVLDNSGGFYHSPVDKRYRSKMNICFRLPTEELEAEFIALTHQSGMLGLKGHRSVGGLRASIYNAVPPEDVKALADLMQEFQRTKG